jgi:hypothetical protein
LEAFTIVLGNCIENPQEKIKAQKIFTFIL